jgi:tetratricopeptide (TPR) repeat protein
MRSEIALVVAVIATLTLGVSAKTNTAKTDTAKTNTPAAVRVWEDTMVLPTYEEGPPDVNAPFDIFMGTRFSYPYTLRTGLTTKSAPRTWRTLNLENEYLRCVILPDLGGHLYTCVDKVNGRDLFYANTAIKFANVAYRGAWAALGIEFNFPVSHNWMTISPVDYAITRHADGSASVWIGNIDRVYGGQWRVELTLRPRHAVLEQHTSLYNRSASRHRFYWWTNAAVRVQDDSRILYPTRYTAAHGFASVDTWPIDARGVDLSVVRTHTTGPVSLFSHGSHEPFMAIYHPSSHSGVAHYAAPIDLPAKKFWSWGSDPDGLDWRVALSDDKSAYVEVQAGLFRNQETYEFLEPQETIAFTEYWLPLREIGGMVRATPDAALNVTRSPEGSTAGSNQVTLDAAFTVTRPVVNGHLRVSNGSRVIANEPLTADPSRVVRRSFPHLPADAHYTIEVSDARATLVSHTEDTYDLVPSKEITTGPQQLPQLPPASEQSDAQVVEAGRLTELDGKLLDAYRLYERGLDRTPESFVLAKAAGRLAVRLKRPDDAIARLTRAERRVSNDPEVEYYLGEAYLQNDDIPHARPRFILAQQRSAFRAAARLELARIEARPGTPEALDRAAGLLADIGAEFPDAVRAGQAQVAVLRHLGRAAESKRLLDKWRRIDPTNSGLRYEAVLAGARDATLWPHLAADPDRLIEISEDYFALGFFADAAALLAHPLPHGDAVISEPGMPAADANPLIAYYRGYARQRSGASPDADFDAARQMSTTYIFPHRWDTGRVLDAALARDARDATARFLLGSWYLSGGRVQPALEAWNAARAIDWHLPGLQRNLGLTLLLALDKPDEAVNVFREGLDIDPQNVGVYLGLDQALSLTEHPAAERAAALARFPHPETMPAVVTFRLALALAEAGRFADAEGVFAHRFFAREEGGTNVRQVYLEVRLLRAREAATQGHCDEALGILDGLASPIEGLAFTRDGLPPFLDSGRLRYERGTIEAACGRRDAARAHLESVLKTEARFPFVDIVFAARSAQRLCDLASSGAGSGAGASGECRAAVAREWQPRLEQALAAATRHIDVVGTSVPGAIRNAQGLLLASLGRAAEARQRFREALQANDAMLSHHLAREALAALPR